MYRKLIVTDPSDPYEYVIYNSLDKDESSLIHRLSFHRLCTLLRRYPNVKLYSVDYWNELFAYFCIAGDFNDKFCSIEQVENSISLDVCVERLEEDI